MKIRKIKAGRVRADMITVSGGMVSIVARPSAMRRALRSLFYCKQNFGVRKK